MLRPKSVIAMSLLLSLVALGGAPPREYRGVRPGSKAGFLALRPGRYEFNHRTCLSGGPPGSGLVWSQFVLDVGADGVRTMTVVSKRPSHPDRSLACFAASGTVDWTNESSWTAHADAGSDVFFPEDPKQEPFRFGCDVTEVTVHSPDVTFEEPKGVTECGDW